MAIRLIFRLFQPERAGFISKQGAPVKAGLRKARLAPRPKITNINRHLQDRSGPEPMKAAPFVPGPAAGRPPFGSRGRRRRGRNLGPARLAAGGGHDPLCRRHHHGQHDPGCHLAGLATITRFRTLQTSGVVNAFWQSQIQATSSGKLGGKNLAPALYDSFYTGRAGKKQEVSLTYEGRRRRGCSPIRLSTTGFEVKPDDTKNTLDPLSAITFLFSGVARGALHPTAPVFDGRRRYDIETDQGARRRHQDGQWPLCRQRRAMHSPATSRSRLSSAGAEEQRKLSRHQCLVRDGSQAVRGPRHTVPVRIWADTKYGVLAILATALKVDGQTPKGSARDRNKRGASSAQCSGYGIELRGPDKCPCCRPDH